MSYRCAVIGNPVIHSRSPQIHARFAAERGIDLEYDRILAEADEFPAVVQQFFAAGGRGLNITVPYKETAWRLCDTVSDYARAAAAVNTLWMENGKLCGDNTDGRGLCHALEQEHHIALTDKRILILGAGGAARGVVLPLAESAPALIHIANRSASKAHALVKAQQALTTVPLTAYALDELPRLTAYDLIINATSSALHGESLTLPANITGDNSHAYDMDYGKNTPFLQWAAAQHLPACDGYSMLIAQARLSFQQWFPQ